MNPIYLDYNATTPIDPAVLEAMLPYLKGNFGNPSSTHVFGQTAHTAVEQARGQVAELLDAQPEEIVFTGGGTEASNQAIKGAVFARMQGLFARWFGAPHIITSTIEPELWQQNGGTAAIRFFNGSLIVTAPRSVHEALGGYVD